MNSVSGYTVNSHDYLMGSLMRSGGVDEDTNNILFLLLFLKKSSLFSDVISV